MNSPLGVVVFMATLAVLTLTLLEQQEEHQYDVQARQVAEIMRSIAALQRDHALRNQTVEPFLPGPTAGRFYAKVDDEERDITVAGTTVTLNSGGVYKVDQIPGAGDPRWDWFRRLPNVNSPTEIKASSDTAPHDQSRFSTWAARAWLRAAAGGLVHTGVPLSPHEYSGGQRGCCLIDAGSVQVIYEAPPGLAARVAREFGANACLGGPVRHAGGPAAGSGYWLSFECGGQNGSLDSDDNHVIAHFAAPTPITALTDASWRTEDVPAPTTLPTTPQLGNAPTRRPVYGALRLRDARPNPINTTVDFDGSTLFTGTSRGVHAALHDAGAIYATGEADMKMGLGTNRRIIIEDDGDLEMRYTTSTTRVRIENSGLFLEAGGADVISLTKTGGDWELDGVGSIFVEGTATVSGSGL